MDESGDLGFGKSSSRHITVAAVIVEDGTRLERIPPEVRIRRLDSLNSRGLQVADYEAGAIQRKHEIGDASYHAIIAPIIVAEKTIRL